MIFIMTLSSVLSFSFVIPFLLQPISVGLTLLILSIFLSLIMFFISSTWFSFILFLIYIGGMLVMFAYVTALMPNLKFNTKNIMMFLILNLFFWIILFFLSEFLGVFNTAQVKEIYEWNMNMNNKGISLFSPFNLTIVLSLAVILFFVLIAVVKICYFSNGPLRPYKYA